MEKPAFALAFCNASECAQTPQVRANGDRPNGVLDGSTSGAPRTKRKSGSGCGAGSSFGARTNRPRTVRPARCRRAGVSTPGPRARGCGGVGRDQQGRAWPSASRFRQPRATLPLPPGKGVSSTWRDGSSPRPGDEGDCSRPQRTNARRHRRSSPGACSQRRWGSVVRVER